MLTIRMQRTGRSGHAQFRVIVQDKRVHPSRGKVVAYLGSYDPHTKEAVIDKDVAKSYLDKGAQPTDRVAGILKKEGVKLPAWYKPSAPQKKAVRNPEKRRSTRPDEPAPAEPAAEAEAPVEEAAPAEPAGATPETPAEAPAEALAEEPAPASEPVETPVEEPAESAAPETPPAEETPVESASEE